jgi:hypothetical protein
MKIKCLLLPLYEKSPHAGVVLSCFDFSILEITVKGSINVQDLLIVRVVFKLFLRVLDLAAIVKELALAVDSGLFFE